MTSEVEFRTVSRRRMVSLLGLAAVLGFAVSPTGVEAQTTGTTGTPPAPTGTTGTPPHRHPPAPPACSGAKSGAKDASNGATSGAEGRLHQASPRSTPSAQTPTAQTPPAQK